MNHFKRLWDLGYRELVPVIPPTAEISERSSLYSRVGTKQDGRGKTPGLRGSDGHWYSGDWLNWTADDSLDRWNAMGAGVGVKMGNGLHLIDVDTMNSNFAQIALQLVTEHFGVLCCRMGNPPKAGYLIRVSGPMDYMRIDFGPLIDGKLERCEILGKGKQAVFEGIHPKTMAPYYWPFALKPFAEIPVFTPQQVKAFLEELATRLPAASKVITEGGGADINQASLKGDLETVSKAVRATPNTNKVFGAREDYVSYGYAIKAALPDNQHEAFELFSDWCSRWENGANDPAVVASEWARMKPPFRRGASWLFEIAERENPVEFKNIDRFFDVIPDEEPLFTQSAETKPTDVYQVIRIDGLVNRPPLQYLVDRHVPEVSVGIIYAAPGAGKTFLALDMGLHIAYGLPTWHGDAVNAGADTVVVYIAAEGSYGFRNRILAWLKKRGLSKFSERFVMIEQTINFMTVSDVERLLRTIKLSIGARPVLIVVDTVSQAIPGAKENAQEDMSLFISACNRVRDTFKCAVLGIHHAGKDGNIRGSTVLSGAADYVFRLDREKGASVGHLRCEKQKDGPDGWSEPYRFDLVGLEDGHSSWVPERCEQSIGPDRALTPALATDVFTAMATAWDEGKPWGATYHSRERRASAVMSRVFDIEPGKAEQLLRTWADAGDIVVDIRDKKKRLSGYRVVRAINPSAPPQEGLFG